MRNTIRFFAIAAFVAVGSIAASAQDAEMVRHFDYDRAAPLNIKQLGVQRRVNATVYDLTYDSPKGGVVPAYLVVPQGRGPFAAIVWGHWYWQNSSMRNRKEFLDEAVAMAPAGVVSLLTDGPINRPGHVDSKDPLDESIPLEFLQQIIDMRRAVDLLLARHNVDPNRIAFVGHSYNAGIGALLSGLDRRFKAFVLMAGGTSDEVAQKSKGFHEFRQKLGPDRVDALIAKYKYLDQGLYASHAAPATVFLQYGSRDAGITPDQARQYAAVVSEPKRLEIYDADHNLNAEARRDRIHFLVEQLEVPPTVVERSSEKKPPKKRPARKEEPKAEDPKQAEPLAVLERKLTGHQGWVYSVAVSPDGEWVVSGSADKTVKIWGLKDGKYRATLKGHTAQVNSVAITSDGKWILSGSDDKSARIWDPSSGHEVKQLTGHKSSVQCALPLPRGRLFSGTPGDDQAIRIWEMLTGRCTNEFKTQQTVMDASVNEDGTRAVISGHGGKVAFWDILSGKRIAELKGHKESSCVWSVAITRDGRFAVSGSNDKTVKVWDLESGTCVGTLEGHQGDVHSVEISPDDALIASAGFTDDTVRLWDWKSGTCLQVIKLGANQSTMSVAFSPDGSRLVVGTTEGTIYVYHLTGVRPAPSVLASRRYVNAKVVLLGEGTVGKTSLAHRLIEDKYVIKDRTHGMNVWRLELPLSPDATLEREALLWDLAGQEDYRLIHQLFLDETALALLLINPQKDDPFAEAGDWLKALKTASDSNSNREAEKLLVYSQVDVGGPKLSDAKIDEFRKRYGFSDWLLTSAKSGRNCSDKKNKGQPSKLKQLIAESIPWDKLPWTSTPRLLAELKNAVVAMREERDIRLLRFAELTQRLEQALPNEKFGESDVRTAVTLLSNHGLARPLKFGDLVLLQPELLNGYAGAIIRAARAHTDEIGCVLEADIYRPGFDFTGVERLKHRPDEELLLRALVQTFLDHSLCIAEDTPQGRQLVFPSQYRREKDIPHDPNIFVSYTFSGEWQTVWTTLVVRLWYSQEFEHRELWRNAAEFASPKGYTLGLKIDNQQGEGTATISLYFDVRVEDDLKAIFIEFVHRHLAKFGCEVSRDRRYVCLNPTCNTPVTTIDTVRRRLEAKKTFIICQECDKKVPLIDFIEQRLKSDPVARKIMAMDEVATRELDSQALEQILIGHMMAIAGEANQIFRPVTMFDHGIDGEVEFKDSDGKASGKRIYIQLKSGNSYLRTRKSDGSEVFDVTNERHLEYWVSQPVDVYLVIRQTDEASGGQTIRWMNVTRYLKNRKDKLSRQIVFEGEKLDMAAVWKVRDRFFRESQRGK